MISDTWACHLAERDEYEQEGSSMLPAGTSTHWSLGGVILGTCCLCLSLPAEESYELRIAAGETATLTEEDVLGLSDLVRLIALQNIPHDYRNEKEWGSTKEVWAGIDFKQDGLRLTTKRRKRTVNHGSWKRYEARLIDPDRELLLRIENVRAIAGRGADLDLIVDSHLAASGRWSEWRQGVQLFSFSADATARVRMRVACQIGIAFNFADSIPQLRLSPTVTDADLQLTDFRLHRISNFDGPVIHQLGHALQDVLQDELNDRRGKLVTRINSQIAKHQSVLQLSPGDADEPRTGQVWQRALELQRVPAEAARSDGGTSATP